MPKTFDTTPDGITWRDQPCAVVLYLITCKREVPRNKGDTSGVSVKGTSILKSVASTVSIRSGGGGWHRASYSGRYRTLGVKWYKVVGVECHAIVLLSAGIGRRGKSNAG
ncbi:hypothetical protein TIFTF001_020411 [Ficus carica]|uniref:Uncharacterized protein n=1 Tax=Ficus carica TaxID=3494 RepID=A0AA88ADM8_FICCA|nr:hypothetical protein TIFTF001_020411 [Ficus carica]